MSSRDLKTVDEFRDKCLGSLGNLSNLSNLTSLGTLGSSASLASLSSMGRGPRPKVYSRELK